MVPRPRSSWSRAMAASSRSRSTADSPFRKRRSAGFRAMTRSPPSAAA